MEQAAQQSGGVPTPGGMEHSLVMRLLVRLMVGLKDLEVLFLHILFYDSIFKEKEWLQRGG